MKLIDFLKGKVVLLTGVPTILRNVLDAEEDFDAVNLRQLRESGGGSPNFNLDIQTFSEDTDLGAPLIHNGGVWGNFGNGPQFFEIFIGSSPNDGNLVTFYIDRFNCDSEIFVEATGPYVSEMVPDSGTSWTVPANSSVLGTFIGFTTPGQKEIVFVATACGVSRSVTIFFNVESSGDECYPMYDFDIDLFSAGGGVTGYDFGLGGNLFNDMSSNGHSYDISFLALPVGGGSSSSYDYKNVTGILSFPCDGLSVFNSYKVTITVTNLDLGCTYCITQEMTVLPDNMPVIYTMFNCGGGSGIGSGGSGDKNAAPIGGKYL